MNIDLEALRTIERERGVHVKDLLEAIAGALLYSYLDYRAESAETKAAGTKSRVDIDADSGAVSVIVTESDPETGEVSSEYDDTPENFGRIGAQAVRDAILRKLRENETERTYDSYSELTGTVVSGVVQRDICLLYTSDAADE